MPSQRASAFQPLICSTATRMHQDSVYWEGNAISARLCLPAFDLLNSTCGHIIHVLQQFLPSHRPRCGIHTGGVMTRARASLRECSNFLAHLNTDAVKPVLGGQALL